MQLVGRDSVEPEAIGSTEARPTKKSSSLDQSSDCDYEQEHEHEHGHEEEKRANAVSAFRSRARIDRLGRVGERLGLCSGRRTGRM